MTVQPSRPSLRVREATEAELDGWDHAAVDAPGGHVYQSLAWAEECRRLGWQTRLLRFDDGFAALSVERTWPLIGGRSAYLPRGPIPRSEPADTVARLTAITGWLAERGVDVVATDSEVPAATGYPELLRGAGFRAIAEIQPSRHRLSLPLGPGCDEEAVLHGIARQTRQRIRGAERSGLRVVRHDARGGVEQADGFVPPATESGRGDASASSVALEAFYDLLEATGGRRGFRFGPREDYLRWWRSALAAGHLVLLEARADGEMIAGLVLYRHGGRLSTVHSGDRIDRRGTYPGAAHLLRWRAIQLALREGCAEMDLGGVDVAGARREPVKGEPMYGLYEHKRSFGAVWLELAGAHERVIRPARYRLGRLTGRLVRLTLPGRKVGRGPAGDRPGPSGLAEGGTS